jgi:ribosome-associated translation inhibitor RaiA
MTEPPTVVIRFKGVDPDEELRQELERRTRQLAEEFPETRRFELSLESDGAGFTVHGHVNGKNTEVATNGEGPDLRTASDRLFERVRHRLRRMHEKRIFQRRREAQKTSPKR